MPALDAVLVEKIATAESIRRLRAPYITEREGETYVLRDNKDYVSFSCNDYLGLSHHQLVVDRAMEALWRYGAGAGGSRLITGNHPLYSELEAALADYKDTEAALVFGSGYLANLGVVQAVMGKGDLIVADRLIHACLLDGAQLSGAKMLRFAHNDVSEAAQLLEEHRSQYKNCLLITETVFSMDGDVAPIAQLGELALQHDAWLMTDDAHGLGLLKTKYPEGLPTIQMGTLSKTLGSYGGYVCGSKALITFLQSQARPLVYSTALPPASVAAAIAALRVIETEPELTMMPLKKARQFTQALGLPKATSAIVPLILETEERALSAAADLLAEGFLVLAIRPPTVPVGTARLRFAFSALHEDDDIARLANVIRNASWFKETR